MPPYSENVFIRTQNGDTLYAYSTPKGAGATAEDIIHIENTGLDDLLVKMQYCVDWSQIATSAGVSVALDGYDLFNQSGLVLGAGQRAGMLGPMHFEYIIPAQSDLKITAHCHAGDTGAFRSAQLVAYPLKVGN